MSIVALERTGRGSRKFPEIKKDWEDEYRKLKDEHKILKALCNEQEEHIRK